MRKYVCRLRVLQGRDKGKSYYLTKDRDPAAAFRTAYEGGSISPKK
jgi:hypothetical protein